MIGWILIGIFAFYLLTCKAWPYFLYPNYFRPASIESYPALRELAMTLRGTDKLSTLRNVYDYMQRTYSGHTEVLRVRSILSVFRLGDFPTENILGQKQFLWCHVQNKLFRSLAVQTGMLEPREITTRARFWSTFFIHQWLEVCIDVTRIVIDPYYSKFDTTDTATPCA